MDKFNKVCMRACVRALESVTLQLCTVWDRNAKMLIIEKAQTVPVTKHLATGNLQYITFIDKVSGASVQLISFRMFLTSHFFSTDSAKFMIHLHSMLP